jgi:hypothetical protein
MFKKYQNKNKYFTRYFTLVTLLIGIVFLKISCKKSDTLINNDVTNSKVNTIQFFNLPAGTNSAVARVAKELERQNQKTGFVSTLATQAGFPVWDKSNIRLLKDDTQNSNSLFEDYKDADTCILVPMVLQDAKYVNAFISATIVDDSITMRMYYRNDYKAYPLKASRPSPSVTTAEDFAIQMMALDKDVFGYTKFAVEDKRLFLNPSHAKDTAHAMVTIELTPPNTNSLILCTTFEYTISVCTGCIGTCDHCGFPTCYSISWSNESCREVGIPGGGGGGWPSAPPSGPGGTGGGGGSTTGGGNCVVGGLVQNGFAPPNPCNPPGGGNPLPPATSQSSEINPTISDDDVEVTWWNDPNTNYPPQTLPSWDSVYAKYPKDSLGRDLPPGDIYRLIGGTPLAIYLNDSIANGNACAARLSRALLYSGITIPSIPTKTFMGSDGKYYFLSAAAMFDWMSKTFGSTGSNVITLNTAQGGLNGINFGSFLVGKKGIYIMRPISRNPITGFGASGHATIYNGTNCIPGSDGHATEYFDAQGGVHTIRLWKLN